MPGERDEAKVDVQVEGTSEGMSSWPVEAIAWPGCPVVVVACGKVEGG